MAGVRTAASFGRFYIEPEIVSEAGEERVFTQHGPAFLVLTHDEALRVVHHSVHSNIAKLIFVLGSVLVFQFLHVCRFAHGLTCCRLVPNSEVEVVDVHLPIELDLWLLVGHIESLKKVDFVACDFRCSLILDFVSF